MGRSRRIKKVKDIHWQENTGDTEQLFTGRFQCDICKKFFLSKSTLERHYGIHSNGKALVCSRCGKLQPLIDYKIKLSKEIPLMSEVSGNCSKKESYLGSSSTQLKDWKYVCDVCKQRFVCGALFEMHYRKHIGKKSLYCDSCSEATSDEYAATSEELGNIHTTLLAAKERMNLPLFRLPTFIEALDALIKKVEEQRAHLTPVDSTPKETVPSDTTLNSPSKRTLKKFKTEIRQKETD
ncbi:hypothetical protein TNIN_380821 [Trichonephila inaurata madagascariensis]|uniref:C2H2-type domain-containing protein n=1 Tax=Trichonephila inaurata madagascariensis TaxID=2747483 RepID=A0A8X7C1K6_9ARAC|nr:hypothetical protein TNIN_380821 [Trichonephila inaurata madagascariensis]